MAAILRVFCAPGRGETYAETMKGLVRRKRAEISTVDFAEEVRQLPFSQQVTLFQRIIGDHYWSRDALLLGRSFGAWILLNALVEFSSDFPGTVILMSAILGSPGYGGVKLLAPRTERFWDAAEARDRPPARRLALIHSIDDWRSPFALAVRLRQLWGVEVVRFTSGGHDLGAGAHRDEVADLIEEIWS